MGSNVTLTLDGSRVTHTSPDLNLADNPTSRFMVAGERGALQEYVAGDAAFGRWVADRMRATFDQEYYLQGGTLSLATSVQQDQFSEQRTTVRTGVWFGTDYCVKTHVYGGVYEEIVGLLEQFDMSQEPFGIVMRPRTEEVIVRGEGSHAPSVAMLLDQLAIIHTYELTEFAMSRLPSWSGLSVEGGELFIEDRGEPTEVVILVGPRTITSLQPRGGHTLEEVVAFASHLVVDWVTGTAA